MNTEFEAGSSREDQTIILRFWNNNEEFPFKKKQTNIEKRTLH